jgi:hypothetical protein
MSCGQEESIATFPGGLVGAISHRVEEGDREYIGSAERLSDETLSVRSRLAHGIFAYFEGMIGKLPVVPDAWFVHRRSPHPLEVPARNRQWISRIAALLA